MLLSVTGYVSVFVSMYVCKLMIIIITRIIRVAFDITLQLYNILHVLHCTVTDYFCCLGRAISQVCHRVCVSASGNDLSRDDS